MPRPPTRKCSVNTIDGSAIHKGSIVAISHVLVDRTLCLGLKHLIGFSEFAIVDKLRGLGVITLGGSREIADVVVDILVVLNAIRQACRKHKHQRCVLLLRWQGHANACGAESLVVDGKAIALECRGEARIGRKRLTTVVGSLDNAQQLAVRAHDRATQHGSRHVLVLEDVIVEVCHELLRADWRYAFYLRLLNVVSNDEHGWGN